MGGGESEEAFGKGEGAAGQELVPGCISSFVQASGAPGHITACSFTRFFWPLE